jgi:hypothetical protein
MSGGKDRPRIVWELAATVLLASACASGASTDATAFGQSTPPTTAGDDGSLGDGAASDAAGSDSTYGADAGVNAISEGGADDGSAPSGDDSSVSSDGGCAGGTPTCGGVCVDYTTDPNNCGGCGAAHACSTAETCNGGVCSAVVPADAGVTPDAAPDAPPDAATDATSTDRCAQFSDTCGDCTKGRTGYECGWCSNACYTGTSGGPTSRGVCGSTKWIWTTSGCP